MIIITYFTLVIDTSYVPLWYYALCIVHNSLLWFSVNEIAPSLASLLEAIPTQVHSSWGSQSNLFVNTNRNLLLPFIRMFNVPFFKRSSSKASQWPSVLRVFWNMPVPCFGGTTHLSSQRVTLIRLHNLQMFQSSHIRGLGRLISTSFCQLDGGLRRCKTLVSSSSS